MEHKTEEDEGVKLARCFLTSCTHNFCCFSFFGKLCIEMPGAWLLFLQLIPFGAPAQQYSPLLHVSLRLPCSATLLHCGNLTSYVHESNAIRHASLKFLFDRVILFKQRVTKIDTLGIKKI